VIPQMAQRDYYAVLGVQPDADQKTIKDAFRELALKYHPDRNKAPDAEERFKEIAEAYAILSDPKKRAEYDSRGFAGVSGFTAEDLFGGIDFEDLLGGAGIGLGDLFGRFFGRRTKGPPRGADIELHLELPLEKIASGGPENVHVSRMQRCQDCGGSGAKAGTKPRPCEACKGTGRIVTMREQQNILIQTSTTCTACRGQGQIIDEPCPKCGGTGRISIEQTLEIQVPPGIEEATVLRIAGHGEASESPVGAPGDLYVHVTSAPDSRFVRMGADLWHELEVPVVDAVLGSSCKVPTLKKPVSVRVPAGTQPGTVLRLKGKGLPKFGGSGNGDLLVRVSVRVPEKLEPNQMNLWQQLRALQEHGQPASVRE
jgi:molecular chaperone DnaJ